MEDGGQQRLHEVEEMATEHADQSYAFSW